MPVQVNTFPVVDDQILGDKIHNYLRDSVKLKFLDSTNYPTSYQYLSQIKNKILNSSYIQHKEISWKVILVDNDSVLNVLSSTGGYIYIYTGIIKNLDCQDYFAGMLAHEIAHADRRHVVQNLSEKYGVKFMLDAIFKDTSAIAQLSRECLSMKFTQQNEHEADEYSVRYLSDLKNYEACNGATGFFEALMTFEQTGNTPPFLNGHPDPGNRPLDIDSMAQLVLHCDTNQYCHIDSNSIGENYLTFKDSLP